MAAGLNIAALARRTGVAADTLRKWEQRYRILQPTRTPGGQRRYSERDVARVEWLRARLSEGYRIGEAATLLGRLGAEPARSAQEQLRAMLDSIDRHEPDDLGVLLDQAFALNEVEVTLGRILSPLLRTIGESWGRGDISVADEHLVSEAVRSRLGQLLADAGGGVRGVAVLACAPGERHELGLMMAAIALRRDGWKVFYLGSDTPVADAVALTRRISARLLGISVATAERAQALERELASAELPAGVSLVVGGAGASPALAQRVGALYAVPELMGAVAALRSLAA
jgi:DNA-binding transcriptional MerR regulator/methylmalonyl-CoA mutase cobalamin-binding subunit